MVREGTMKIWHELGLARVISRHPTCGAWGTEAWNIPNRRNRNSHWTGSTLEKGRKQVWLNNSEPEEGWRWIRVWKVKEERAPDHAGFMILFYRSQATPEKSFQEGHNTSIYVFIALSHRGWWIKGQVEAACWVRKLVWWAGLQLQQWRYWEVDWGYLWGKKPKVLANGLDKDRKARNQKWCLGLGFKQLGR